MGSPEADTVQEETTSFGARENWREILPVWLWVIYGASLGLNFFSSKSMKILFKNMHKVSHTVSVMY